MLARFKRSLEESRIIRMGSYDYIVSPLTDGIPRVDPAILREVLDGVLAIGDFRCGLLLAPEAMGIPLVAPLSLELSIPFGVVRKRGYGLPGEVNVNQVTGYSKGDMFINGVMKGERVVVIDDIISTGGTLRAIIKALLSMGVELVDVIAIIEKSGGKGQLEKELGIRIKTLVKVEVQDGRVYVS